jgi:hypothetical protein
MILHRVTCVLAALAVIFAIPAFAGAATISVSFTDNGDVGSQSGEMQSNDLAGAPGVRVANWNNYVNRDAAGSPVTGPILGDAETVIYDDGTAVGGGFQVALTLGGGGSTFTDRNNGAFINDVEMFNGVIDQRDLNVPTSVVVTNVPFATYDVYAYMFNDGAERAGKFAIGGTSYYARGGLPNPANDGTGYVLSSDTVPTGLGLPAVDQGNYVRFAGLTGSSFTLEAGTLIPPGSTQTIGRNKWAGFQIVAVVPEPTSLVLIALGAGVSIATIGRRRA